jgi:hypothetical protein
VANREDRRVGGNGKGRGRGCNEAMKVRICQIK